MLGRDWFSLVWLSVTVNFMGKACRPLAGGGPASTHFSCLAKKSEQKKATQALLHFRFPIVHYKKWIVGSPKTFFNLVLRTIEPREI